MDLYFKPEKSEKKSMAQSAKFKAQLVIIEGNDKGKIINLSPGFTLVGRSKTEVVINDPRISREHVKLEFDSEKGLLRFTDLKSLNGCQINGNPEVSGELRDGDRFQIGNTILDCQMTRLKEVTEDTRKEPILKTESFHAEQSSPQDLEAPPTQVKSVKTEMNHSIEKKARKSKPILIALVAGLVVLWFISLRNKSLSSGETPSTQSVSEMNLSEIRGLFASQQYSLALEKSLALYQQYPKNAEIEELLGDIYLEQKTIEPSLQFYKRSIEHKNSSKLIHFKLVKAYLAADFVDSAIQHLSVIDQLIKETPEENELFIELAGLLLAYPELNQSYDRAFIVAKALQKEIAPNNPLGYRLEASIFLQKKQLKEAEDIFERALALAPDDQNVLEELTMTKLNLQDISGAKKITEQWLKQNPNEVRALLATSYLEFYEKNYLSSIPHLMRVMNLLASTPQTPRRLEAMHLLGLVFWEQGQTNEAANYLTESCKLGFQASCQHQALLKKEPSQP